MSNITSEEVTKIANLARLTLTSEEITQATSDLSGILSHFSTIQDIDTTNVSPSEDISGLRNISRTDEVKSNILGTPKDIMKNVPHVKDGYVQVAGVFSDADAS
jgi:aspartyl-tRNA(Asn)/glutamyl-tRNA(Gln) amidotransferase subunit C